MSCPPSRCLRRASCRRAGRAPRAARSGPLRGGCSAQLDGDRRVRGRWAAACRSPSATTSCTTSLARVWSPRSTGPARLLCASPRTGPNARCSPSTQTSGAYSIRPVQAEVIDGKAVAARVRAQLAERVAEHQRAHGAPPGLATVLVGEDPASTVYVEGKQRACREVGMAAFDERLPADADRNEVGVLLQLPLPAHLPAQELIAMIDPLKDVDGLTPINAGLLALGREGLRPCTPLGVMRLLEEAGVALEGREAVVIGRSNLFGKPMAALLLLANATVTICHSRTRNLAEVTRRADLLIAAAGRPRMVRGDWVKEGAVVIDVGISRISPQEAGNRSGLVGDVDFAEVAAVASAITPVPGGVGPMTIAMLLANTLQAAQMQVTAR